MVPVTEFLNLQLDQIWLPEVLKVQLRSAANILVKCA